MSSMIRTFRESNDIPCHLKQNIKIYHYFRHDLFFHVYANDEVYGFGPDIHKYVGYRSNGEKFIKIKELCGKGVEDFYGGWTSLFNCPFFFAKCANDDVYAWGDNYWAQLGVGDESSLLEYEKPQKVQDLSHCNIMLISCGFAHCLAVDKNGVLYVWGDNKEAQLGVGRNRARVKSPIVLGELYGIKKKIKYAHAKGWSSIVVTHDGEVYSRDTENLETWIFKTINQFCSHHGITALSVHLSYHGDFFQNVFTLRNDINGTILSKTEKVMESKLLINFESSKTLGQGRLGIVIEATNIFNNKKFAIKIITKNYDDKILKRDIELMTQLKEEYVVRFIDCWSEEYFGHYTFEPRLYIQMELCSMNLKQLLLQHHENSIFEEFHFFISCKMFGQITECINYLHNCNIIHRNIKPENVLVSINVTKNFLKLSDFGLSIMQDIPVHTENVQNQVYIAPEVILYEKFTMKSDIYSLALIALSIFNIEKDISNFNPDRSMDIYREKYRPIRNECNYDKLFDILSSCIYEDLYKRPSASELLLQLDEITEENFNLKNNHLTFSERINQPSNCYFKELLEKNPYRIHIELIITASISN